MSKPLGPGDRAIVVKAVNPENLGKLVLVVAKLGPGQLPSFDPPGGAKWLPSNETLLECESMGGQFTIVSVQGRTWRTPMATFRPDQLARLDDDSDSNEETRMREEELS